MPTLIEALCSWESEWVELDDIPETGKVEVPLWRKYFKSDKPALILRFDAEAFQQYKWQDAEFTGPGGHTFTVTSKVGRIRFCTVPEKATVRPYRPHDEVGNASHAVSEDGVLYDEVQELPPRHPGIYQDN